MRNSLVNRIKYALQAGNVVDLDARGFVAVTSNSDSTPTVVNYAKMFGNKIALDVDFGEDADIITITPPFGFIVNYAKVQSKVAISGGTITIKKDVSAISDAVSTYVDSKIVAISTLDDDYSEIETTDTLNIVNATAGVKAVTTLDILPI